MCIQKQIKQIYFSSEGSSFRSDSLHLPAQLDLIPRDYINLTEGNNPLRSVRTGSQRNKPTLGCDLNIMYYTMVQEVVGDVDEEQQQQQHQE